MQTKKDHVHAYRFASHRMIHALVTGDTGAGESPMRRPVFGTVMGVLLAALLCGGFTVFGFVSPGGNTSWRKPGSVVLEKETGSRYVYLDGVLHPVGDYASALLAASATAGGQKPVLRSVSRSSLAGVPRGARIGIPGAPDSLPGPGSLLPGSWARCLRQSGAGEVLDLAPANTMRPLPADRLVLLAAPGGRQYVLWHGVVHPVAGRYVLVALGLGDREPLQAATAWLKSLPAGPALAAATIPGDGSRGFSVGGAVSTVGQTFSASRGAERPAQRYVLRADGLAPISETEYALFTARPGHPRPRQVGVGDIAAAPASADRGLLHRIPDLVFGKALDSAGSALCLRQRSEGTTVRTAVALADHPATGGRVKVPVGAGVLAASLPLPSGAGMSAAYYLINDQGVKYPLADDGSLRALGFDTAQACGVPKSVLDLLPVGPTLSAAAATTVITAGR
ncbi:type VII secretion protein EccB [Streptomyces sp. NPDC093970]|uniref:type VII secretion protein EccB n=1 Tax=Streptomyces sp. NPDC093970 TaxID=3155076 RepID=UPI00341D33F3